MRQALGSLSRIQSDVHNIAKGFARSPKRALLCGDLHRHLIQASAIRRLRHARTAKVSSLEAESLVL